MKKLVVALSMIVAPLIADFAHAQSWDASYPQLMEFNLAAPGVQPNAVEVKGAVQRGTVVNGVAQGTFRVSVSALFPKAGSAMPTDLRTASVSGTWTEAQPINFAKNHLLVLALAWIVSGAPETQLEPFLKGSGQIFGAQVVVDRAARLGGGRLSPASRQATLEMARSFVDPQALVMTDRLLYRAVTFIPLRTSTQKLPVRVARFAGPAGRSDYRVLVRQPHSPSFTSDLRMNVTVYRAGGSVDHFTCKRGGCDRFLGDEQWFGGDAQWFLGDEQWFGGDRDSFIGEEQWGIAGDPDSFLGDEQWGFLGDEQWFGGDEHWLVSFSFPIAQNDPTTFIRAVTVSVVDALNPTRSGFCEDYTLPE